MTYAEFITFAPNDNVEHTFSEWWKLEHPELVGKTRKYSFRTTDKGAEQYLKGEITYDDMVELNRDILHLREVRHDGLPF